MPMPSCPECEAIHRELLDVIAVSRRYASEPGASVRDMIAWFEQREIDPEYTDCVRPALATVRRRLVEHCTASGHQIRWPRPPGSMNHPN